MPERLSTAALLAALLRDLFIRCSCKSKCKEGKAEATLEADAQVGEGKRNMYGGAN